MKWFFVGIYSGGVDKKHIPDQDDIEYLSLMNQSSSFF